MRLKSRNRYAMKTNLFDFTLPESAIATHPAEPRDHSRLLHVANGGSISDKNFYDLPSLLREGDLLIFNDSKVIPARLFARKESVIARNKVTSRRGRSQPISLSKTQEIAASATPPRNDDKPIELLLHKQQPNTERHNEWLAFAKPGRKCKISDVLVITPSMSSPRRRGSYGKDTEQDSLCGSPLCSGSRLRGNDTIWKDLTATVITKHSDGQITFRFNLEGTAFWEALEACGHMPLPPYIKREDTADDKSRYQTVYAKEEGSVAAPTAGLHFMDRTFDALKERGVTTDFVTLHVGAGTFQPVKVEDTDEHVMHSEYATLTANTAARINETKKNGGRVIAVGTTAMRTLESATDENGITHPMARETNIFITPGYRFRCVDALLTNFHLPKSTLFMLISAFAGLEEMQTAYAHAIANNYRFYSYGDACLLELKK